jgi:hypothetical protein
MSTICMKLDPDIHICMHLVCFSKPSGVAVGHVLHLVVGVVALDPVNARVDNHGRAVGEDGRRA